MKEIPNIPILSISNQPLRVPDVDEDGNPLTASDGRPLTRKAVTADLLRITALSRPRPIWTMRDPDRVMVLLRILDHGSEEVISLHDPLYDWIQRMFKCTIEQPEKSNLPELSYGQELWGDNAYKFLRYMSTEEDGRKMDKILLDDSLEDD